MARYRKKPVEVEARQLTDLAARDAIADWIEAGGGQVNAPFLEPFLLIETLEGVMRGDLASEGEDGEEVKPGDWVIQGVAGEFYPCKPDIFEQTYEAVD